MRFSEELASRYIGGQVNIQRQGHQVRGTIESLEYIEHDKTLRFNLWRAERFDGTGWIPDTDLETTTLRFAVGPEETSGMIGGGMYMSDDPVLDRTIVLHAPYAPAFAYPGAPVRA